MHLFIWKIHANFHKNFLTTNIQIRSSLEKKKLPFSYSFYHKIFPIYFQVIPSNTHWIHQYTFQSLALGRFRYCLLLLGLRRCYKHLFHLTIPSLRWPLLYELYSTALQLISTSFTLPTDLKKKGNMRCLLLLHYWEHFLLRLMQVTLLLMIMGYYRIQTKIPLNIN